MSEYGEKSVQCTLTYSVHHPKIYNLRGNFSSILVHLIHWKYELLD